MVSRSRCPIRSRTSRATKRKTEDELLDGMPKGRVIQEGKQQPVRESNRSDMNQHAASLPGIPETRLGPSGQYNLAIFGEEARMLPAASAVRKKLLAIRDEPRSLPATMLTR